MQSRAPAGTASLSSLLSEKQFQCSICLDIFTSPVTTPCGHNFCMACIGGYWDRKCLYECPLCLKQFKRKPKLHINTGLRQITEQFKRKLNPPEERSAQPGEVPCDICTGRKLRAVKSCLVCMASYCQTHLEPHERVKTLTRHKLIEPVRDIEDRLCKKHQRVLELFCKEDLICICHFCTETDHKTHSTVTLEEECRKKKAQLGETEAEVQQKVQARLKKVEEIRQSVELRKLGAQREAEDSEQVFRALVCSIERSQAELLELIEESGGEAG
ncbi:E3 ubiquitin/ISG15 ligase TRIM25-like [Amia ocellicauda]|uniref:E3 ubiquitin/ISG15 ligase TRIM25-like n=1 Tax=Amia ocellicauda TaxID=2972642 RepID=UPI003463C8E7